MTEQPGKSAISTGTGTGTGTGPSVVVFACVHNAGRSQMAAALFNKLADPAKARAISAGTQPATRVHPEVIAAMRELGIDLTGARPQLLTPALARGARLLITMGCGEVCDVWPGLPDVLRDDWPLADPKGRPLAEVRKIREDIKERVQRLVELLAASAAEVQRQRPLLRGVFHLVAFFLAIPALAYLVAAARSPRAALCATIYAGSLLALLGISGCYHRITWSPAARARVRLIDHCAIFLLIAGTCTPINLVGVGGALGTLLCAAIWVGALLGILQTLLWRSAPRWLHLGIYVLLGWAGVFGLVAESRRIGLLGALIHVAGGVIYTLGAVIYARKRPDPWPRVLGYHEVYHLLVIIACACLFEVVRRCLAAGG